ncbi:hypothetical protein [Actinoplanes xinjiangensis]|uniref:DUF3800 domain-containing protein n=1 Tax=Actinoplanes xinjiangensis TaxID=512350 RepID=A0A316FFI4_9ACTN|nr:hypothetical protein [Actinoplanes xinjiangensis]PWK47159.1 hypothetical protein BC793_108274 [Actinoplanes xinjiangensis]GIF40318.1 hypothetical protein Axi01nite_46290 [Actinoplanes xinjiangensis]
MRSPLQGGLPPAGTPAGAVVEIACDESGFSGANLLRTTEPVITHASVDLSVAEAVDLIAALRLSPFEVKSGRFLRRPDADEALARLLAALRGRAHVHRIDKEFFLVTQVVDLLLGAPSYRSLTRADRPEAHDLYQARAAGADWQVFLAAFADMVRTRRRIPGDPGAGRFLRARDTLAGIGGPAGAVLATITDDRVAAIVARLDDGDRSIPPPLEPMLAALAGTILHWSAERRQVLVTHDEQSALTADRLARLQRALTAGDGPSPLAGLVMADSRDDPRIQIADLLAGVARRRPDGLVGAG